jgi:hypothetical protein
MRRSSSKGLRPLPGGRSKGGAGGPAPLCVRGGLIPDGQGQQKAPRTLRPCSKSQESCMRATFRRVPPSRTRDSLCHGHAVPEPGRGEAHLDHSGSSMIFSTLSRPSAAAAGQRLRRAAPHRPAAARAFALPLGRCQPQQQRAQPLRAVPPQQADQAADAVPPAAGGASQQPAAAPSTPQVRQGPQGKVRLHTRRPPK